MSCTGGTEKEQVDQRMSAWSCPFSCSDAVGSRDVVSIPFVQAFSFNKPGVPLIRYNDTQAQRSSTRQGVLRCFRSSRMEAPHRLLFAVCRRLSVLWKR
jgi:hypothetical protein